MKNTLINLLSVSILILLQGCISEPDLPLELTLADANQPVFVLVYIAKDQGYFDELNLKVNTLNFSSGRDALASVVNGQADLATVYETPVVLQAFAEQPIRILSTLHRSVRNTALVVRRDHNIEKVTDLVGKNIGVPLNTNAEFFINQFLSSFNISQEQVNFVNLKPSECPEKIKTGEVDAIAVWNPYLFKSIQSLPEEKRLVFYSDFYSELSMLVGVENRIAEKRPAYKRFLQAIKQAELFLTNHPEKSKAIVISQLKNSFDEITINNTWGDFYAESTLSNSMLNLLSLEAKWMVEQGRFAAYQTPDFSTYIDESLMQEVDPLSVTLPSKTQLPL